MPFAHGPRVLVFEISHGIAAVDPRDGHLLWSSTRATDTAIVSGNYVFANHESLSRNGSGSIQNTLVALNSRSGSLTWAKPDKGGVKIADASDLFVANFLGITAYTNNGHVRWNSPQARGDRVILLNGPYVLSEGSGGEPSREILYSLDRKTGRYIGSDTHSLGRVLEVDHLHVIAQDTFLPEVSLRCFGATLLSVTISKKDDPADVDPILRDEAKYYSLDDALNESHFQCVGKLTNSATLSLDRSTIAVSSGPFTTIYDRREPKRGGIVFDDASMVGGPFASYYFVSNVAGLDAVRVNSGRVTRLRLLKATPGVAFHIAGIHNRLYASNGTYVSAFDAAHLDRPPIRTYALACPQALEPIARVASVDILACSVGLTNGLESGRVVGLPSR